MVGISYLEMNMVYLLVIVVYCEVIFIVVRICENGWFIGIIIKCEVVVGERVWENVYFCIFGGFVIVGNGVWFFVGCKIVLYDIEIGDFNGILILVYRYEKCFECFGLIFIGDCYVEMINVDVFFGVDGEVYGLGIGICKYWRIVSFVVWSEGVICKWVNKDVGVVVVIDVVVEGDVDLFV